MRSDLWQSAERITCFADLITQHKMLLMLYSFFGNCKIQNINPREWLEDTLQQIPKHSIQKLKKKYQTIINNQNKDTFHLIATGNTQ